MWQNVVLVENKKPAVRRVKKFTIWILLYFLNGLLTRTS